MINSNTLLRIFILFIFQTAFQSCYHYHVSTGNFDPGTEYQKKTVCSMFWGLAQKDITAYNCDSLKINSLDEVHVSTNLGYSLITVATRGIVSPLTVKWKCSKPCPREGEIP